MIRQNEEKYEGVYPSFRMPGKGMSGGVGETL